jgi:O-antigen/teichoic acid export membrane protein
MAQLVSGFLIIRWVAPEELGLWQLARVAQVYSFLLLFGINNGLARELPFFLGKGDLAFSDRLAGTAFFCATAANAVVLLAGVGCVIAFGRRGSHLTWAIIAVTLTIVITFYQQIFTCAFRSKDSFQKLTGIQLTEASMNLATIPLVYFFHYNGMLIRAVLIAATVVTLMYIFRPMRVKMRMDWAALKILLKTGIPIFGLDYAKNSCGTMDRVVLAKIGGTMDVGFYSLAGVVTATLGALPTSLATYLYPRMSFKYGEDGNPRSLWRMGIRFVLLGVAFTGLAAVGARLVLPSFVPAFIPKYVAGLKAAEIVLVAGVLEAVTLVANALWSMKIWRLMVAYQIGSAALFAAGPILGVLLLGKTLEAVAWGAVMGSLGRSFMALGLTYYGTHRVPLSPTASASPI